MATEYKLSYTAEEINRKLGEKQVQSDWNQTDETKEDYIRNKPNIEEEISYRSGGVSNKYKITKSGWKRIQNIIRGTNGSVGVGIATGYPDRMVHMIGFDFTGYVRFPNDTSYSNPIIIKKYENLYGNDEALINGSGQCKITAVRIGYPKKGTSFPNTDGRTNYKDNPTNCYLDVYIEFNPKRYLTTPYYANVTYSDEAQGTATSLGEEFTVVSVKINEANLIVSFENGSVTIPLSEDTRIPSEGDVLVKKVVSNETRLYPSTLQTASLDMNFAGFSYSHNCEGIIEETEAIDTGMYGEELEYYTVAVSKMKSYVAIDNFGAVAIDNFGVSNAVKGRVHIGYNDPVKAVAVNISPINPYMAITTDYKAFLYGKNLVSNHVSDWYAKYAMTFLDNALVGKYVNGNANYAYLKNSFPKGVYNLSANFEGTPIFLLKLYTSDDSLITAEDDVFGEFNNYYQGYIIKNKESVTINITQGSFQIGVVFMGNTVGENTVISNIQLEVGSSKTEFIPYQGCKVVNNSETVDGILPITTVATDCLVPTEITIEYEKDINKVIEELTNAIISLGGNV